MEVWPCRCNWLEVCLFMVWNCFLKNQYICNNLWQGSICIQYLFSSLPLTLWGNALIHMISIATCGVCVVITRFHATVISNYTEHGHDRNFADMIHIWSCYVHARAKYHKYKIYKLGQNIHYHTQQKPVTYTRNLKLVMEYQNVLCHMDVFIKMLNRH
jgi:hypothetical protein